MHVNSLLKHSFCSGNRKCVNVSFSMPSFVSRTMNQTPSNLQVISHKCGYITPFSVYILTFKFRTVTSSIHFNGA